MPKAVSTWPEEILAAILLVILLGVLFLIPAPTPTKGDQHPQHTTIRE